MYLLNLIFLFHQSNQNEVPILSFNQKFIKVKSKIDNLIRKLTDKPILQSEVSIIDNDIKILYECFKSLKKSFRKEYETGSKEYENNLNVLLKMFYRGKARYKFLFINVVIFVLSFLIFMCLARRICDK